MIAFYRWNARRRPEKNQVKHRGRLSLVPRVSTAYDRNVNKAIDVWLLSLITFRASRGRRLSTASETKRPCGFTLKFIPSSSSTFIQAPRSKVPTMTISRLEGHARFMGFRDCPGCGETLFAAEHAEFICTDHMILCWRCDACDHAFQTTAAVGRDVPTRVA
jgi:hypothetical protein